MIRLPALKGGAGAAGSLLGALAEALREPGHPATGVEDLLLARVEGVAGRADVGVDAPAGLGAARREGVAAGAAHRRLDVGGVDVGLHGVPLVMGSRRVVG